MGYGDIAKELCGIARELTDLAERLSKIEEATPALNPSMESMPIQKTTLSVEEMAEVLGVSRQTAYNQIHRKDFPVLRIGKRVLIPKGKLIQWINTHCSGNTESDLETMS